MASVSGDNLANALLRALPVEVADNVLTRIPSSPADKLRKLRIEAEAKPGALNEALREFFDLMRIADRTIPQVKVEPPAEPAPAPEPSPVDELRGISGERLVRVLSNEPAPAIALILSCLDSDPAGDVLKRLQPELRAEVTLRLAQMGDRNQAVVNHLARAVVEKNRALSDVPAEPTQDVRLKSLAQSLKGMPREDRLKLLQHIDDKDAKLADRVRSNLYSFEDILRIPDRSLQVLLGELETKTLALALSNADSKIRDKIMVGLSSRAKANLQDETQMLGTPSSSLVTEARDKIVAIIRREEEAGKIQLGD